MSVPYTEVIRLLKEIKESMNKPENSGKAGEVLTLLKKINKKIDNYENWLRKSNV